MSDISAWDVNAAGNTSPSPNGWPEGMAPDGINNSGREVMAAVRRWYADPEWLDLNESQTVAKESATEVRITGIDLVTTYAAGRRIKLTGGGDQQGYVVSAALDTGDTVVTVKVDGGADVAAGTTAILLYLSPQITESIINAVDLMTVEFFA